MSNNQPQNNNSFGLLDLITIISLILQIENIQKDNTEKDYIHLVIKSISEEIEKLHEENDLIIDKLNQIEKYIKK